MSFDYESGYVNFQHDGQGYSCLSLFNDNSLDVSKYGIVFLTSPYYQAEEDYYTAYFSSGGQKYPIGCILPLQLLDEDDKDYVDTLKPHYKQYANLAVREAILYLSRRDVFSKDSLTFHLSDYFCYPDLSLFIYSKKEIGEDISCIYPSLYDTGYCLVNNPFNKSGHRLYKSSYMASVIAGKPMRKYRNVLLKPVKFFIPNQAFFTHLYTELMPYVESPFYRFVILYQVIELLSNYTYENDVDKNITRFNKKEISKNDLREKLTEAVNEKKQIQHVYSNVMWKDDRQLLSDIDSLFAKASIDKPNPSDLPCYIYMLRNKIVHEMHNLFKYENELKEIVGYLEKNIFNLLAENRIQL